MKAHQFILLLFTCLLQAGVSLTAAPAPFTIEFGVARQGVPMDEEAVIEVAITSSGAAAIEGKVALVDPNGNVVPRTTISGTAAFQIPSGKANGKVELRLDVGKEGEYLARLEVSNGSRKVTRALGIVAEDGKVWFGHDTIENALWNRVNSIIGIPEEEYTEEDLRRHRALYQEKLNAFLARKNAAPPVAPPPPKPAPAQGDNLIFEGNWQGPGAVGTNTATFPMDGVKIMIKDLVGGAVIPGGEGYIRAGKFAFTSPRSNFTYTATLQTEFPGILADGSTSAAAGGIGAFKMVKQTAAGGAGAVYEKTVTNTLAYTSTEAADGVPLASAWSVFHGMGEMVRQAKKQLSVDKEAGFTVIFETTGNSRFSSSLKTIYVLFNHRFEWDVIAHEFGHAVAAERSLLGVAAVGGGHDGSNQYVYAGNPGTLNNKTNSLILAFNEGFGTWFGAGLLEMSDYKGSFRNVGDKKYDDTHFGFSDNMDLNTAPPAFGEDTEVGIQNLLWDLYDSVNENNSRTSGKRPGLRDNTSFGLNGTWALLDNGNFANISDFWKKSFLPNGQIDGFLQTGDNAVQGDLRKALNAADTFAEFGLAPVLGKPDAGTIINLATNKGPKFTWSQEATVHADLKLNKFRVALYLQDLKTLLWVSSELTGVSEYELTADDLEAIRQAADGKNQAAVIAVVVATSDTKTPATGPYLSNGIELLLQNYDRAVVMVVDSSGSNSSTDPSDQRIVASQETVRRLVSAAEGAAAQKAPDLAAAIDFDSSVSVLSNFADPDVVAPVFSQIDSSGGTCIDCGISRAINLLENINANGFQAFIQDRAAIVVFTDGENNSGPGPVIAEIVRATAMGIRVHFGFLQPISFPPPVPNELARQTTGFSTIEEAVRASGGVYAIIGDAESQIAFVNQIYTTGLANNDRQDPGGAEVVGQTTTFDEVIEPLQVRAFAFRGRAGEQARVRVTATGFQPFLTVFDQEGAIIGVDKDEDNNGLAEIPLVLPYTGPYVAEVFSRNGAVGKFRIFVDVENPAPVAVNLEFDAPATPVLNRQTGLFEQTLTLRNTGTSDAEAFRLMVDLPEGTILHGATGETNGVPFLLVNQTIAAGGELQLRLEYFDPNRGVPEPVISVENVPTEAGEPPVGELLEIVRTVKLENGDVLLEFPATPGATYYIEYSEDLTDWKLSPAPIVPATDRFMWIDSGPPKTESHPSTGTRFYRVLEAQ